MRALQKPLLEEAPFPSAQMIMPDTVDTQRGCGLFREP